MREERGEGIERRRERSEGEERGERREERGERRERREERAGPASGAVAWLLLRYQMASTVRNPLPTLDL